MFFLEIRSMKKYLLLAAAYCMALNVAAQKIAVFDFNNTLTDTSGKLPPLHILERPGVFVDDTLHELENRVRKVYDFDINSGLSFNNTEAGNFFTGNYTIELYFKLDIYNSWKRVVDFKNKKADSGPYIYFRKVSFYKSHTEDIPHLTPGEYLHYVITRDASSKEVNIYIDGNKMISFVDNEEEAVLNADNRLNFFHDNHSMGNEASAGAIAMCKIYGAALDPVTVKGNYQNLGYNFDALGKRKVPKPQVQIQVKGNVYDAKNGAPVAAAIRFELASDSAHVITINNNGLTGDYSVKLTSGKYYAFYASSKGYIEQSNLLDLSRADPAKAVVQDIVMSRLEVGKTISLSKISFLQSKFELLPSSFAELDKLADLMKEHEKMEILINGHTDNQGNPKLNLALSENRVKAVKDYLISRGVEASRIKGKGFGGSKPIASNATEATRKLNRRVELTILKY